MSHQRRRVRERALLEPVSNELKQAQRRRSDERATRSVVKVDLRPPPGGDQRRRERLVAHPDRDLFQVELLLQVDQRGDGRLGLIARTIGDLELLVLQAQRHLRPGFGDHAAQRVEAVGQLGWREDERDDVVARVEQAPLESGQLRDADEDHAFVSAMQFFFERAFQAAYGSIRLARSRAAS